QVGANQAALVGYSPRTGQSEREWEAKFRTIPDPANLREYMRRLSARPHHVGSAYDKDNAEWILAHFKEWGLDAHIERFDVLFPTPKVRLLEMLAPTKFTAKLEEPALAVDPTSNQKSEQLPTYNAYSIDGDVTGPLVFVVLRQAVVDEHQRPRHVAVNRISVVGRKLLRLLVRRGINRQRRFLEFGRELCRLNHFEHPHLRSGEQHIERLDVRIQPPFLEAGQDPFRIVLVVRRSDVVRARAETSHVLPKIGRVGNSAELRLPIALALA